MGCPAASAASFPRASSAGRTPHVASCSSTGWFDSALVRSVQARLQPGSRSLEPSPGPRWPHRGFGASLHEMPSTQTVESARSDYPAGPLAPPAGRSCWQHWYRPAQGNQVVYTERATHSQLSKMVQLTHWPTAADFVHKPPTSLLICVGRSVHKLCTVARPGLCGSADSHCCLEPPSLCCSYAQPSRSYHDRRPDKGAMQVISGALLETFDFRARGRVLHGG